MRKSRHGLLTVLVVLVMPFFMIGGCGNSSDDEVANQVVEALCPEPNLDISVCDPEAGPFSLEIDNSYFPLVVGSVSELEGEDDEGTEIRLVITVLDETEEVAGVMTRVVEEDEFEDDERVETSWNFYAQVEDGTVCYFGEDVDNYEDGEVINNDGSWRAGEDGSKPGIIMPGDPMVGDIFMQENAPGIAEDQAEIVAIGGAIDVEAGEFDDTLFTEDCNPLGDPGEIDEKVYVGGIGLSIDEDAELVSFEEGM